MSGSADAASCCARTCRFRPSWRVDGVGHLLLDNRLLAAAVFQGEHHHRLILLQRNPLLNGDGLRSEIVGDDCHVHFPRRDVAPHAADHQLVLAVEPLGTDVDRAVAAETVVPCLTDGVVAT